MTRFSTLFLSLVLIAGAAVAQPIRVVSSQTIGHGFMPRISQDGQQVRYLVSQSMDYPAEQSDLYVTNEDLHLYLYRNGQRTELTPHGAERYICPSLSPNKEMILFRTQKGTAVCDLQGRLLYELGNLSAPSWYGNEYILGMRGEHDGHDFTNSRIYLRALDGEETNLTNGVAIDMFPTGSAETGRVVYNTVDGNIRMLQLNLTDQPILSPRNLPRMQPVVTDPAVTNAPKRARKNSFSDIKIYINPGHGGYTGNDRGMTIYPFAAGDTLGFWESSSNLHKGLILDSLLRAYGVQTMMSRVLNREIDDKNLYDIVCEANGYGADFMLSIHSNAGGPSNYILQLYSGKDEDDRVTYNDYGTRDAESRAISTIIGNNLNLSSPVSDWTYTPRISGDKTFARTIMGWSNGYGVLRYLRVPGEISEGGMHDYFPQTYRLMNMDYKHAEAYQFARSFFTYFLDYTMTTGVIGGQVRDSYQLWTFPAISVHRRPSLDAYKPLCGALVELIKDGEVIKTYTTDQLYNGVFYFWDLTPGTYTVRASKDGYYSGEYEVTVPAGDIAYQNIQLNLQRQTPPTVVSYSPHPNAITDSVQVSSEVRITFDWDMQTDSTEMAFSVTPAVEGKITWLDDNRTLCFIPNGRFEPGTEYTVNLSTVACHPDASWPNHLQTPLTFSFRTMNRGSIRYLQSYPADGETDVPVNPSFVTLFDQKIANTSVRDALSLTDASGNAVTINTRSITCNSVPSPYGSVAFETTAALQPATSYTLTFGATLKDNIGIYLNTPRVIHFTTAADFTSDLPLVDRMDTLLFKADYEKSFGHSSLSTLRNTNKKYTGIASNELSYKFSAESAEAFYTFLNPMLIQAQSNDRVGLYVFSDFSGNELWAEWSCEGDIKYTQVCTLDYGGWKWQEMDMSSLPEHMTYQLMALRVVRGSSLFSSKGSVYLNNLSYKEGDRTDGLEDIQAEGKAAKVIEDNQVIIIRNGVRYNAIGQVIE